ncbi:STAS/SEC14 domain-containing protein [Pyxidicoccus fallax]|uniref:STAS/SEC14 domain-containing protein n=1 Tax=Pyxidicoccus fallax TaxID=394095 RepID=A0A848LB52_9BACT|nr:STAS/SEC14 domain-containing protein [Pyxidicoccus fallax]NMO16290.1 STAS/SEC14 domain-containing protein [Pyxidicoccus fallax]NPC81865.1 STAS/SEC14 domain-containing protein [Pyxidicoccus fallax]
MGVMWTLGRSKLWFEGPDTLRLAVVGVFDLALVEASRAVTAELLARQPTLYLIADLRQSSGLSPELRKALAAHPDESPYTGIVLFGASLPVRTAGGTRSHATVARGTLSFALVETEEEAKAWVAALREDASVMRAS